MYALLENIQLARPAHCTSASPCVASAFSSLGWKSIWAARYHSTTFGTSSESTQCCLGSAPGVFSRREGFVVGCTSQKIQAMALCPHDPNLLRQSLRLSGFHAQLLSRWHPLDHCGPSGRCPLHLSLRSRWLPTNLQHSDCMRTFHASCRQLLDSASLLKVGP